MRFLRILLRLVEVGLLGQVLGAIAGADQLAHLGQRILRNFDRVGAHIGNQANRAFLAQLDALVEPLRQHHRALGGVAQAVVGRLLQLRGGEGWRGVAALFFLRDRGHLPAGRLDRSDDLLRFSLIRDFDVLAFVFGELGLECRRLSGGEQGVNRPILLGNEGADVALSLDDQAQRYGLHAAGRKPPADLIPEQGGDFVAHQAVQHAAGLLRVHQVQIDLPGFLESCLDRFGGDFVEQHPEDLLPLGLVGGEHVGQMRADRFAFAVRVRGKIDSVSFLTGFLQLRHHLGLARNHFVGGLEPILHVNAKILLRQVFHVAEGSFDAVVAPQILVDGFRLGRRFHDD